MLSFYRRARRHKTIIASLQAARNHQRIAGDPTRLVRRQEHRDRRYIVRLSGPPERRLRDLAALLEGTMRMTSRFLRQSHS